MLRPGLGGLYTLLHSFDVIFLIPSPSWFPITKMKSLSSRMKKKLGLQLNCRGDHHNGTALHVNVFAYLILSYITALIDEYEDEIQ